MDLNDIWQEHKAWILGVLGGVLVFFIGHQVISGRFDTSDAQAAIRSRRAALAKPQYGRTQRSAAIADAKALDGALGKAEAQSYFKPRADFELEGKGDMTVFYLQRTDDVRTRVQRAMDAANVEFAPKQLGLPVNSPVDRAEAARVLYGLDLVDDVLARMLRVSDGIIDKQPDAQGLRSVDSIRITAVSTKRPTGRRGRKTVDLGDRVNVEIKAQLDAWTLQEFLEVLLGENGERPLVLKDIDARTPDRPGEPMELKLDFLILLRRKA